MEIWLLLCINARVELYHCICRLQKQYLHSTDRSFSSSRISCYQLLSTVCHLCDVPVERLVSRGQFFYTPLSSFICELPLTDE